MSYPKIGTGGTYRVTMVGDEKAWEKKIEDINNRQHEVVRQGKAKSSQGGPLKYWADIRMPER